MIPDLVHHQCPSNVTMEEQRPSYKGCEMEKHRDKRRESGRDSLKKRNGGLAQTQI